jgi:hypothetical protein
VGTKHPLVVKNLSTTLICYHLFVSLPYLFLFIYLKFPCLESLNVVAELVGPTEQPITRARSCPTRHRLPCCRPTRHQWSPVRTQHSTTTSTSAACSHLTRSCTGRAGPLRLSHTSTPQQHYYKQWPFLLPPTHLPPLSYRITRTREFTYLFSPSPVITYSQSLDLVTSQSPSCAHTAMLRR